MSPETTLTVMSHKSPQVQEKVGTIAVAVSANSAAQVTRVVTTGMPMAGRKAMFVLNEAPTHTLNRVSQQNQTTTIQSKYYYYNNSIRKNFLFSILLNKILLLHKSNLKRKH